MSPAPTTTPARIHRKVPVPTQEMTSTAPVSTPITSRGKPIDTATPTCLTGPKLAALFLRFCFSLTALLPQVGRETEPELR
jgi:hypothetical protein